MIKDIFILENQHDDFNKKLARRVILFRECLFYQKRNSNFCFFSKVAKGNFFLRLNLPGRTQVNRILGKYNRPGTQEPMA